MVVQPIHFRDREDGVPGGRLHRAPIRGIHGQGQVGAPAMIIHNVSREHAAEVVLGAHDPVIQTRPPKAPDEALRIGRLPRAPRRRKYLPHAQRRNPPLERSAVGRIAIPTERPGYRVPREGLNQWLCGPLSGRARSHVEMENPSSIMGQHDQRKEHPEPTRRDREDLERNDLRHMVLQESPPGGSGGRTRYFSTVDFATAIRNFRSSPRTRESPIADSPSRCPRSGPGVLG